MTVLDAVKIAFALYFTYDFVQYARTKRWRRDFLVFRHLRGWMIPKVLLGSWAVLAVVITVGTLLYGDGGSVMQFSWLGLLASPADGPHPATNLVVTGIQVPWFGLAFGLLLALNMPRLARIEEVAFRKDTKGWGDACWRSLKFGLCHAVVGVPIAYCLALSLAGLWFTWHYWQGGVTRATLYHVVSNLTVLLLVGILLVF